MAVDNPWMATSKWEVMELHLKSHVKDRQKTSLLLRVLARNGDTPRGSGEHSENGGRIVFLPQHGEERANVAIFEGHVNYMKQLGIICGNSWAMLEPHYMQLRNYETQEYYKSLTTREVGVEGGA